MSLSTNMFAKKCKYSFLIDVLTPLVQMYPISEIELRLSLNQFFTDITCPTVPKIAMLNICRTPKLRRSIKASTCMAPEVTFQIKIHKER